MFQVCLGSSIKSIKVIPLCLQRVLQQQPSTKLTIVASEVSIRTLSSSSPRTVSPLNGDHGFKLITATEQHQAGVLTLTKDSLDGLDFLVQVYNPWLEEARHGQRLNYVMVKEDGAQVEDTVVGYVSFYLMNGGRWAFKSGGRIHPSMRGRGLLNFLIEETNKMVVASLPHEEVHSIIKLFHNKWNIW